MRTLATCQRRPRSGMAGEGVGVAGEPWFLHGGQAQRSGQAQAAATRWEAQKRNGAGGKLTTPRAVRRTHRSRANYL